MTTDQADERAVVPADLVLGIDHIGIAVLDLETASAFYTEVLGLVERHREVNTEQGVIEAMLATPSAPEGSTQLQLLAPLTRSRRSPASSTGQVQVCSSSPTGWLTSNRSQKSCAARDSGCSTTRLDEAPTEP